MSEWKEYKLGDIITTNKQNLGKDYTHSEIKYLDTGSITKGKIEDFQNYLIEDAPSRAKRLVEHNDIIYSTVRPIQRHYGFIENPDKNLVVSTGFTVISSDSEKVYPKFLYYFLASDEIVELLDVIAEGSTSAYPSLKPSDIERLDISLPTLSEQKAIASVLSSLDDKIDLLHRQNQTLEAMAETLFRQWFQPSQALRSAGAEEAEEDWEEGELGDLIHLEYGKGLKKADRTGQGYPVIGSSGVIDYHKEFLVEAPGIVIGRKGTLGETIYLTKNFHPIDTTYYIDSKVDSKGLYYEYFLLKNIGFEKMNTDSAVPGLNRNIALATELLIPPRELIKKFSEVVEPMFKKIETNQNQINLLEKLRDTLLPKLMSGKVSCEL